MWRRYATQARRLIPSASTGDSKCMHHLPRNQRQHASLRCNTALRRRLFAFDSAAANSKAFHRFPATTCTADAVNCIRFGNLRANAEPGMPSSLPCSSCSLPPSPSCSPPPLPHAPRSPARLPLRAAAIYVSIAAGNGSEIDLHGANGSVNGSEITINGGEKSI